ncbi:MAG: Hsp20/alpha crystallin family protein, partial [Blastocatellia bacterium]
LRPSPTEGTRYGGVLQRFPKNLIFLSCIFLFGGDCYLLLASCETCQDFNRIFSSTLPRLFSNEEGLLGGNWAPNVDIYEDQNSITLEAELPGLKPGDFNLSIENYRLTLSGERKFENEKKDAIRQVHIESAGGD